MTHNKLSYDMERELTDQLRAAVRGRWDIVLPMVIPEIQAAIDAGARKHVDCILPGHYGRNDFRIHKHFAETGCCICTCTASHPITDGIDLIMRVRGCDFVTAKRLLMEAARINVPPKLTRDSVPFPARATRSADLEEELQRRRNEELEKSARRAEFKKRLITDLWNNSIPLTDLDAEPAYNWFCNRGVTPIKLPIADIRFHRGVEYYYDNKVIGTFPCILSMLRDNQGKTMALHRTYITRDGLKPEQIQALGSDAPTRLSLVPDDRCSTGSAIRFDEPTTALMLAEGIETALTIRLLTGLPTWACTTKDLLMGIVLPESVKIVTVWADKDRSGAGQQAASTLVHRLREAGYRAVAMLPPSEITGKGVDWNDVIRDVGLKAMRNDLQYRQWDRTLQGILNPEVPKEDFRTKAFTY